MAARAFRIHHITEHDWAELRALRIEMLADTPHAYHETLSDAESRTEQEWRIRAARNAEPGSIGLAAIDSAGHWVGTMAAYLPDSAEGALLVGVFVSPRWRGSASGVADTLLDGIEEWTARHVDVLTLEVHQESIAARRFYKRRGFEETGRVIPYPLNTAQLEFEMAKPVRVTCSSGARLLS